MKTACVKVVWLTALLLVLSPIQSLLGQNNVKASRLAIIAEQGGLATLSDLLTVELSQKSELQLVEREQIAKVYREQGLSAANRDYLKLGQVLGADGLLLLEPASEGTNQFLTARLLAVKPGVIIGAVRSSWPVEDVPGWSRWLANHFDPLFPKLGVLVRDAIPISVVNLRSAVRSHEAQELERQLTLLAIERLARERQLFVLERRRMELLSGEKELKGMGESAFWNSSYLLEGVIDRDGYTKDKVTIHARLMPPTEASPVELKVEGPRVNSGAVLEELTSRVLEALKRKSSAAPWNPEAEALKYLEEAKWAMRWQMIPEAQSALESSWALGQQNKETAELRIRAWLATGMNRNYCNVLRDSGRVVFGRPFMGSFFDGTQTRFSSPPDPKGFDDMVYALMLFEHCFRTFIATQPKLDPEWLALGNSLLIEGSAWLRQYYFTVEARAGREDQIAATRNLISVIHALIQSHPGWAEVDKNLSLTATRVIWGVFWAETPEHTLNWYREVMQAGQWPKVRRRFLNGGHFRQETQTRVNIAEASDHTNPARPPLGGWKWEDRRRAPALWASFVDELCTATNALMVLEGRFIRCSEAWTGEQFESALKQLLEAVWQRRETLSNAKLDADWLRDLGLLVNGRLSALEPARAKRIKDELWKDFEARFKGLVSSTVVRVEFENARNFFKTQQTHDGASLARVAAQEYTTTEAAELLPLLRAYRDRMSATLEREGTGLARSKKGLMEAQVGLLEKKLNAKAGLLSVNPPPATPPATVAPGARPPVATQPPPALRPPVGPLLQPPPTLTNHLQVDRFRSPKEFGWSWKNPKFVTVSDACPRDQRLWFQVTYQEFDSLGHREEECFVVMGDESLRSGETISLKEQIPSRDGTFLTRLPTRTFEVLNGSLYLSTGNGLRKYSLRDRTWQTLPTPVSGPLRLQRLDNRLFAVTDDSILELNPDGSSAKILASTRRQPPVTILDRVQNYGMPQPFSLGKGDIRVFVKGKGYVLPRGGSDWEITELPQGASLAAAYEDGLFLGASVAGNQSGVWGMFGSSDKLELLTVRESNTRLPRSLSARPLSQEPATPKPRWSLPNWLPPLNSPPVPDGTNLWLFAGGLALESRGGRAAVKEENGNNGLLVGLLPESTEPLIIPLRLGFSDDVVSRQEMARLFGSGSFGERLLRPTPGGLVLTRAGLPGFWFIPRAELEMRLIDFRRSHLKQPGDNSGPGKS